LCIYRLMWSCSLIIVAAYSLFEFLALDHIITIAYLILSFPILKTDVWKPNQGSNRVVE